MILVTGGAGYIGSHMVLSLLQNDYRVVVLDNLINGSLESLNRVQQITGETVDFYEGDVCDEILLETIFKKYDVSIVIHFAALKAVGESIQKPINYYENNVQGSISLLKVMQKYEVSNFIYSSSATVYGEETEVPYRESMALGSTSNPYGFTKVIVERMLKDLVIANPGFRAVSLRYFNPIGAHESGMIGEDPNGIPYNLLPFIAQVAVGKQAKLKIYGDDYPTNDGTCERDYLHVMDLADGHLAALRWLKKQKYFNGVEVFNLGTGRAYSVLQIVKSFERVLGRKISYEIMSRRAGDLAAFWADATKAKEVLGWQCSRSLEQMLQDTWKWQSQNPKGYS